MFNYITFPVIIYNSYQHNNKWQDTQHKALVAECCNAEKSGLYCYLGCRHAKDFLKVKVKFCKCRIREPAAPQKV